MSNRFFLVVIAIDYIIEFMLRVLPLSSSNKTIFLSGIILWYFSIGSGVAQIINGLQIKKDATKLCDYVKNRPIVKNDFTLRRVKRKYNIAFLDNAFIVVACAYLSYKGHLMLSLVAMIVLIVSNAVLYDMEDLWTSQFEGR